MSHSLGSPSSPSIQSSASSPISSRSSSGSSQGSSGSSQGSARMVKLAKIYQKNGKEVKEWDGKEPEPNTAIFVPVKLDNGWIKREVSLNCGDLIRKQHSWYDIQGEPLSFKIPDSSSVLTTVGTYLKLSNSSSTWGQPRILDECWHHVTFLLKKFMREKKIFKFDPRSGITIVSYEHKDITEPDNYSFWLDFTDISHDPSHTIPSFFLGNPIFTEPIRSIPVSEFENPSLYIPFYEYIPWQYMHSRPHKRQKLSGGKSRRRVKRRFKRKTIKRRFKRKTIKRRFKRKTIKRRFTPLKI
jgi:hypothetical protein